MSAVMIGAANPLSARRDSGRGSNTVRTSREAAGSSKLTLTRKGRLVFLGIPALLLAAILLVAALGTAAGVMANPAHADVVGQETSLQNYAHAVTVMPGESLWSIAASADSSRDVREVVAEIVALNELSSGVIHAGQKLFVPSGH